LIYIVATIALIGTFAAFSFQSSSRSLQMENSELEQIFSHWKLSFGKMYASAEEESHRFDMFVQNYHFIQNWNQDTT